MKNKKGDRTHQRLLYPLSKASDEALHARHGSEQQRHLLSLSPLLRDFGLDASGSSALTEFSQASPHSFSVWASLGFLVARLPRNLCPPGPMSAQARAEALRPTSCTLLLRLLQAHLQIQGREQGPTFPEMSIGRGFGQVASLCQLRSGWLWGPAGGQVCSQ